MITHRHHIIPKHAGGTNDPSNIVELTIEKHAEAHRLLWEQYGRIQDKIAWLMLSGKTEEAEESFTEFYREMGKLGALLYHSKPCSPETRAKISAAKRGKPRADLAAFNTKTKRGIPRGPQTIEHKQRRAAALKAYYQTPEGLADRQRASERMKRRNPNSYPSTSSCQYDRSGLSTSLMRTFFPCPVSGRAARRATGSDGCVLTNSPAAYTPNAYPG